MEIRNWRRMPPGEKFLALFDLYFPTSTEIKRNIKLVLNKQGGYFVGFPSFSEGEGTDKKWKNWYQFENEAKQKEFVNAILLLVKPYMDGKY